MTTEISPPPVPGIATSRWTGEPAPATRADWVRRAREAAALIATTALERDVAAAQPVDRARGLLAEHDELVGDFTGAGPWPGSRGRLRLSIGSTEYAADQVLPQLLGAFRRTFGGYELSFVLQRSAALVDSVRVAQSATLAGVLSAVRARLGLALLPVADDVPGRLRELHELPHAGNIGVHLVSRQGVADTITHASVTMLSSFLREPVPAAPLPVTPAPPVPGPLGRATCDAPGPGPARAGPRRRPEARAGYRPGQH